jgi:hypothetical protein
MKECDMSLKKILTILVLTCVTLAVPAQEGLDFGAQIGLGTQTIDDTVYQTLNLRPDLAFGDFGVGLDVEINFQFYEDVDSEFGFYPRVEDWYIEGGTWQENLNLYLTKITYLRWAQKGAPLYAKFGLIEDGTLGNGFIMGNYNNGILRPQVRYQGLALDVDGSLFEFPYIGLETFVGNLVDFDVIGGRFFLRPLAGTEIPLFNAMQIGATAVVDRDPYLHTDEDVVPGDPGSPVLVYGYDVRVPTLDIGVLTNVVFTDLAFIEDKSWGYMLGTGGSLLGFLTYGAQLRVLGPGFIPVYFDQTYDITRVLKHDVVKGGVPDTETYVGWFASLGTNIADDLLVFNASLEGPFGALAQTLGTGGDNPLAFPTLRSSLVFDPKETGIPVALEASYNKSIIKTLEDLLNPTNALIQSKISYIAGLAEISLVYDVRYVPEEMRAPGDSEWEITSKLETAINF